MVRDTSDEMYFQDNQLKSHGRYAVLDDDGIAREESGYYGNGRDVRNYTGGGTKSLNQALGRTGHEMEDRDDRAVRMRHSGGLDTHAEYSGHASIAYHSRGPQAYRPQELPSGTSAHGEIIYRDQPSQSHVVSAKGSPSPDTSPTSDYHASFTNYPTNTVNDEVVYTQAADTRGDNPVYFAGQKKKIGYKDGTAESRLEFLRDAAQRPDPLARPTELFTHQSPDVAKTAPVIASSQALPRMPTNSGGGHYFPGIRAESILGTQSSADNSERPPYDTNPGPYSHRQMGPDRYHFGEIELQPTPAEDHVRGKAQGNHLSMYSISGFISVLDVAFHTRYFMLLFTFLYLFDRHRGLSSYLRYRRQLPSEKVAKCN